MILYFSATGNTRFVAEELAARLGDSSLDLLEKLRRGMYRHLDVAEQNKRADQKIVAHLAQRQLALQARNVHFIVHILHQATPQL